MRGVQPGRARGTKMVKWSKNLGNEVKKRSPGSQITDHRSILSGLSEMKGRERMKEIPEVREGEEEKRQGSGLVNCVFPWALTVWTPIIQLQHHLNVPTYFPYQGSSVFWSQLHHYYLFLEGSWRTRSFQIFCFSILPFTVLLVVHLSQFFSPSPLSERVAPAPLSVPGRGALTEVVMGG